MHADGVEDWRWEVATDPHAVHAFLCRCDAHTATAQAPAPLRNPDTTRRLVEAGAVHLLTRGADPVAMFTLTFTPPFTQDLTIYPPARQPAYLARLAVQPSWLARGTLVGARCVRRACELAAQAGADAVRSEANPDLVAVRALLDVLGFEQYGPIFSEGGRRRVYLQKTL